MLALLFSIPFKFSRTRKKVVINGFCCFLFLHYGKRVGLLQLLTRLMPKASIRFCRNE